ncbi:MAG TPA: type II secretion system F family protein [Cellvibrionaceae bacterium]|nr:type II secretion system F family protein [Cellvibrionaceae bacterium]
MTSFTYQGRNSQGQLVEGRLDGASADVIANQLMSRSITPVSIVAVKEASSVDKQLAKLMGAEKVDSVELIMFSRQMYTITKSGIPLVRGLRGLAASIKHAHFQMVLNDVADSLETGVGLSVALSRHPKVFNHLFVRMINVGESSGNLEQVFLQMAYYMERDEETRKRIKSATRYPMFVMIALAIAITVVNVAVIPKFAAMFAQFKAPLPLVTKILIGTSYVFVNYWWLLLVVVGGAIGGVVWYLKTPQGAQFWGCKKLRLPVVGDIIDRASMARYTRSFGLMLRAGVPLNFALTLCARAIDNPYLAQKIDAIRRGVERGDSLIRTHAAAQMFSPLVLQMIAVGEESGQVEQLLTDVAEFYEREVDYDLKTLSDKIEPILIVIMAVFVTILALGIFLPMWDMYEVQKSAM